ncbi:hypothetical protein HHK36_001653 [Tetracentron sinense]|uniref:Ubiquinone biosynthesis O-methyltransferase, mitochondrial n=1 Tax=Tetracentron sinense TaxID=13715 RepID=A0A835A341_TETSI|nr:hypothetical protein HHK36_001653 [Tetracentron sinense]
MASNSPKLWRTLSTNTSHILRPRFLNPNRNFLMQFSISRASQTLQSRPYTDVPQPAPIDPSSTPFPQKSPAPGTSKSDGSFSRTPISSSLNQLELAKFSAIAETWWDSEGPFKPLHAMNPTRVSFIRSTLCQHFRKDPYCARPFEGLKIADVGCGGGILSEPLARMGATVTGIDAVEKNIKTARLHADNTHGKEKDLLELSLSLIYGFGSNQGEANPQSLCMKEPKTSPVKPLRPSSGEAHEIAFQNSIMKSVLKSVAEYTLVLEMDPVTSSIEYCCTTAEKLVEEQREFDAVIALEVIEHVANPAEFCNSLAALTVSNGATVISTINRSMRSYVTAIIAAEYLLHWLPRGTHQWSSFLIPEELVLILQRASITVQEMAGFVYNPLTGRWALSDDISVNFIAFGTKNNQ